ncbi:hypothetical protein F5Y06DRAFT_29620 [Hypoxylon sp. FL0890]|nr:hypothetical protein F5Y06DRAFT_29620 [Hypoxylon sp. FL0890]
MRSRRLSPLTKISLTLLSCFANVMYNSTQIVAHQSGHRILWHGRLQLIIHMSSTIQVLVRMLFLIRNIASLIISALLAFLRPYFWYATTAMIRKEPDVIPCSLMLDFLSYLSLDNPWAVLLPPTP